MTIFRNLVCIVVLFFTLLIQGEAQQPVSITSAIERQFKKVEGDLLSSAEAMPDNKYDFTPESLNLKNSDFKGVRTFAGQIMHVATDNILIWSAITGDTVRPDIQDVNGPKTIQSKKDILEYLKSSFAVGRKAIAGLTTQNAMELVEFRGRNLSRLDIAFAALIHANEHYGQVALYLRMCGIIPPPTVNEK